MTSMSSLKDVQDRTTFPEDSHVSVISIAVASRFIAVLASLAMLPKSFLRLGRALLFITECRRIKEAH
jgi:hypothetical protein